MKENLVNFKVKNKSKNKEGLNSKEIRVIYYILFFGVMDWL